MDNFDTFAKIALCFVPGLLTIAISYFVVYCIINPIKNYLFRRRVSKKIADELGKTMLRFGIRYHNGQPVWIEEDEEDEQKPEHTD
jgi:hypothetical protein